MLSASPTGFLTGILTGKDNAGQKYHPVKITVGIPVGEGDNIGRSPTSYLILTKNFYPIFDQNSDEKSMRLHPIFHTCILPT